VNFLFLLGFSAEAKGPILRHPVARAGSGFWLCRSPSLDGVSESVTCTLLLDDDDTQQCDNTGTLPSLFSFSSLGAQTHCPAVHGNHRDFFVLVVQSDAIGLCRAYSIPFFRV